jgi:hypothetical protein
MYINGGKVFFLEREIKYEYKKFVVVEKCP